jgi:hypothetical protein
MADEVVCTCRGDVDSLMIMLAQYGMAPKPEDVREFFSSCSEAAKAINDAASDHEENDEANDDANDADNNEPAE